MNYLIKTSKGTHTVKLIVPRQNINQAKAQLSAYGTPEVKRVNGVLIIMMSYQNFFNLEAIREIETKNQ